jgi:hypothetical protein
LNGLDDDNAGVFGQRTRILAVRASIHRFRQPPRERLAEPLEPGGSEREQAGAVIRAVERDEPRPAGRKQCGAQRNLDRILTGDAELRGPRERLAEPLGDLRLGQVAERMNDGRRCDRFRDPRIPMAERRHSEAAGQVDELVPVRVPDAAAFGLGPELQALLRRPTKRPSVSAAM